MGGEWEVLNIHPFRKSKKREPKLPNHTLTTQGVVRLTLNHQFDKRCPPILARRGVTTVHERVQADRFFARVPERSSLVERSLKTTVTVHATQHPVLDSFVEHLRRDHHSRTVRVTC
jgi:hypothetical protein